MKVSDKQFLVNGQIMDYYQNGKIAFKVSINEGYFNGESEYYYPNGKLLSKGTYDNGSKKGEWTYYYENDTIEKIINYKDSIVQILKYQSKAGKDKILNGNGKLKMKFYDGLFKTEVRVISGSVVNYLMDGKWKYIDATEIYKNGKLINGKGYCLEHFFLSNQHESFNVFITLFKPESQDYQIPFYKVQDNILSVNDFIDSLSNYLSNNRNKYNGYYWSFMKFIIDKKGVVDKVDIVANNETYKQDIISYVLRSSGKWLPAKVPNSSKKLVTNCYLPVTFINGKIYIPKFSDNENLNLFKMNTDTK